MVTAIYPGSFDPMTLGHKNIIDRCAKLVDILYVSPLHNSKKNNIFTLDQRISHLKKVVGNVSNVKIITFEGLLADYVLYNDITFIVKGLRNSADFQVEFEMAKCISLLNKKIETLFIPTDLEFATISSSIVKDLAMSKGDITNFVPKELVSEIHKKFNY